MQKDYYSILVRAVADLDPNALESRRALYDRARGAMAGAPLTPSEIRQERFALEAAIRRIEADLARTGRLMPPAREPEEPRADASMSATSSQPARRRSRILIPGLAVTVTLAAGLAGYQYWRKTTPRDITVPAQTAASDTSRVREAGEPGDTSNSYIFKRQMVYYRSVYPAGTIVISKSQKFLYLTRPNTAALRYTIGIGQECANVVGLLIVSAKEDWTGTDQKTRASEAPAAIHMIGGRFGARSLALGETGYRIHGSDKPVSTGMIGCFPLVNDDVVDLYDRVALGARVVMN